MNVQQSTAMESSCVPPDLTFRNRQEIGDPVLHNNIDIAHPAWPEKCDSFLVLSTLDNLEQGTSHFRTVWLACSVVAGNRFDGYLSRSRTPGDEILDPDPDYMLKAGKYWFHVPHPNSNQASSTSAGPYLYPLFRDFNHWEYPHRKIPDFWPHHDVRLKIPQGSTSMAVSHMVHGRDEICRVTGHSSGTQTAHICPVAEQPWFGRNRMHFYLPKGVQHPANTMLLRADLHQVLDQGDFVFVPKQNEGFVVHYLEPSSDLMPKYNNQKLDTKHLSAHCLLVRFAWAIFRYSALAIDIESDFRAKNRIYTDEPTPDSGSGSGSANKNGKRPASGEAPDQRQSKRGPITRSRGGRSKRGTSKAVHDNCEPCESCEEQEDLNLIEEVFPGLHEVQSPAELDPKLQRFYNDIVAYPGYRRVQRIKERALEERRPKGYDPASDDETFDFETEV